MQMIDMTFLVPVVMARIDVDVAIVWTILGWVPVPVTGIVPDVGSLD